MVVLAGALDFGSSWRDELRDFHGKGTWPTVPWPDVRMEGQLHPLFVMRHEVKQGVESMSNLCPELKAATWTKETWRVLYLSPSSNYIKAG